jgi:hypothetical protein
LHAAEPADGLRLPFAVTVGGTEVRYGVHGSGDKDLLLMHGSGAHHLWWHRVIPALDDSWRIVSLDLSGHGESGHRAQYDVGTWAEEVVTVLRAAGCRRPLVAAHSMGGRIAWSPPPGTRPTSPPGAVRHRALDARTAALGAATTAPPATHARRAGEQPSTASG